jgi:prepilin-type N-terminal cleavage/methylation domain-containing protein
MMRRLQRNQGFTLVELTIAIALYSFLLLIVLSGFMGVFWIFNKVNIANKVQQDGRTAIDVITRATRFSETAQVVPGSDPQDFKVLCVQGAEGRLRYFVANIPGNGQTIDDRANNRALYQERLAGDCAYRDRSPVADNDPNIANIQRLTSTNLNVDKFEPRIIDRSISLLLAISSARGVEEGKALDRFESYVKFNTVVNLRYAR